MHSQSHGRNQIIDWEEATIGRESHRTTWWIKETVKIRQEGQDVMKGSETEDRLGTCWDCDGR